MPIQFVFNILLPLHSFEILNEILTVNAQKLSKQVWKVYYGELWSFT